MLQIVHISSEVSPFTKTGGLADVASSLPIALHEAKNRVIIITPYYEQVINTAEHKLNCLTDNYTFQLDKKNKVGVSFWRGELRDGLSVYFIGNKKYFSRRPELYCCNHENARFYLFDQAVLELLKFIKFKPDILHCHDWHTGLIPCLIKKGVNKEYFTSTATVFTIHNLAFQFGHDWWRIPTEKKDHGWTSLPSLDDIDIENINFAKRAILNADVITTVSEQYAEEILTSKFGEDLHRILKNRRKKIVGIINGISYDDYNPATDPGLAANYDYNNIVVKRENKAALQKYFNLPLLPQAPLISMVCRISEQKGFDIFLPLAPLLVELGAQLVVFGSGDQQYEQTIRELVKKYPNNFAANFKFDTQHATLVYAGSDMTLIPSRFEPCGLTQMIALRYGSIPICHHIGGLVDTIDDFNPETEAGNGFVFRRYSSQNLLAAIVRATENFKYQKVWDHLIEKGMKIAFDWKLPGQAYLKIYRDLVNR